MGRKKIIGIDVKEKETCDLTFLFHFLNKNFLNK